MKKIPFKRAAKPALRSIALVRSGLVTAALAVALAAISGCKHIPPGKPLSELTPNELAGRQVYLANCSRCHNADSQRALNGPGLEGVFRQPYLPSGVAANDERVTGVILHGTGLMPAFGNKMDDQQLEELMAYLHTL